VPGDESVFFYMLNSSYLGRAQGKFQAKKNQVRRDLRLHLNQRDLHRLAVDLSMEWSLRTEGAQQRRYVE
jgi:hypothetical protein